MGLCSKCLTTRLQDLFLNEASTCSLATKLSNFWGSGLLEGNGVFFFFSGTVDGSEIPNNYLGR